MMFVMKYRGNVRAGSFREAWAKCIVTASCLFSDSSVHCAGVQTVQTICISVDLRVLNKAFFFLVSDLFNKCKGDLIEVRDGILKTHPNLLENLVFFVEVFFSLEARNFGVF